ncbi:MAG: hypothetical protein ACXW13_06055, partial [Burkholderiaceae bacterium]
MAAVFFCLVNEEVSATTPEATSAGTTLWALPSAEARFALARPPGSGDAWLLSQFAAQARQDQRMVVAISADALDAQRLVDEIRYFDPSLVVRPLPDWETLPYDTLSP